MEATHEIAVPIDYEPSTDQITIVGRRRPWGPESRRWEASRESVTGWAGYTHRVTMRDTLAWEDRTYWLVGPNSVDTVEINTDVIGDRMIVRVPGDDGCDEYEETCTVYAVGRSGICEYLDVECPSGRYRLRPGPAGWDRAEAIQ